MYALNPEHLEGLFPWTLVNAWRFGFAFAPLEGFPFFRQVCNMNVDSAVSTQVLEILSSFRSSTYLSLAQLRRF
jgi:hypothetical protein